MASFDWGRSPFIKSSPYICLQHLHKLSLLSVSILKTRLLCSCQGHFVLLVSNKEWQSNFTLSLIITLFTLWLCLCLCFFFSSFFFFGGGGGGGGWVGRRSGRGGERSGRSGEGGAEQGEGGGGGKLDEKEQREGALRKFSRPYDVPKLHDIARQLPRHSLDQL